MIYVLFSIILLLIIVGFGVSYYYLFGNDRKLYIDSLLIKGIMFILAIFEILLFVARLLDTSFTFLLYSFSALTVFIILYSVYLTKKNKIVINIPQCRELVTAPRLFLCVCVLIIAFFVAYSYFYQGDDGYYVAISNIALEKDIIAQGDGYIYAGDTIFHDLTEKPSTVGWELLVAVLSKWSGIHPAVLFHTVLPFLFIPFFVIAAYMVLRRSINDKKAVWIGVVVYLILGVMWDDAGTYLISPYFTVGSANGKALLWYILFPIVTENGVRLFDGENDRELWISFALTALAGACSQSTGLYAIPLYYISFALPYILIQIAKKNCNLICQVRNMVLAILPIGIIIVYTMINIYAEATNYSWEAYYSSRFSFPYILNQTLCKDEAIIIILYVIAIIYLIFSKDGRIKGAFFFSKAVTVIVLFFNPITSTFVARYITGGGVYWRLLLLFTVIMAVSFGIAQFVQDYANQKVIRNLIPIIMCILLILPDKVNTFSFYKEQLPHQNDYMIQNDVMEVISYFDTAKPDGDVRLQADYSINRLFRQYSSRYVIIVASELSLPKGELTDYYLAMRKEIFDNRRVNETAMQGINALNVDYLVTTNKIDTDGCFNLVFTTKEESLYVYQRC